MSAIFTCPADSVHTTERRDRFIRNLAVALVIAFVAGMAILSFPKNKSDIAAAVDFSEFYCAAQMVRQGAGPQLYNVAAQAAFESKVAAVHVFYNHPPFQALIYLPLTFFSYRTAYVIWILISLAMLAAATLLIFRNTQILRAASQYTRIPADYGLILVLFATFSPVTTCLLLGQDSLLTLLIYSFVFVFLKRGRDFIAGSILACALYKFHFVIALLSILLLRRKSTLLKGFALTALLPVLASVGISGVHALIDYPHFLFFDPVFRQFSGYAPQFMPNLHGLLYLALHTMFPKTLPGLSTGVFTLAAIWLTAKNWREDHIELSFAASLLAVVLCGFYLYNYDLSLLLLPIAILCGELAARGELWNSRVLTAALIMLFVPPLHLLLATRGVYALMAIPVILLWKRTIDLLRTASAQPVVESIPEFAGADA
jgi:hypothetical protein